MLYYKIIDDRTVISQCRTLITEAGESISNPTEEQIFADGWQVYTPPPVIPQPALEPDYYDAMESIKRMFSADVEEMTDEEALEVAALYPTWASQLGKEVPQGRRLWYDGKLWKVIQPHTVQEDWRPADAVSLFVEVSIEEWPEWKQPAGGHDAYMAGAKVTHIAKHWINEIDYNSFEPGVYGWREVI